MSSISQEKLDELLFEAEERDDETVILLIEEIDRLRDEISSLSSQKARVENGLRKGLKFTARKRFLQGQSYMRDRVVLSFFDTNDVVRASLVSNIDVEDIDPNCLRDTLRASKLKMMKIKEILRAEWHKGTLAQVDRAYP